MGHDEQIVQRNSGVHQSVGHIVGRLVQTYNLSHIVPGWKQQVSYGRLFIFVNHFSDSSMILFCFSHLHVEIPMVMHVLWNSGSLSDIVQHDTTSWCFRGSGSSGR